MPATFTGRALTDAGTAPTRVVPVGLSCLRVLPRAYMLDHDPTIHTTARRAVTPEVPSIWLARHLCRRQSVKTSTNLSFSPTSRSIFSHEHDVVVSAGTARKARAGKLVLRISSAYLAASLHHLSPYAPGEHPERRARPRIALAAPARSIARTQLSRRRISGFGVSHSEDQFGDTDRLHSRLRCQTRIWFPAL
jgi:hypothetical protein